MNVHCISLLFGVILLADSQEKKKDLSFEWVNTTQAYTCKFC